MLGLLRHRSGKRAEELGAASGRLWCRGGRNASDLLSNFDKGKVGEASFARLAAG